MTAERQITYRVTPGGQPRGRLTVPGDKSISHRAVMLAALAEGESHVTGFLTGEDCLCTMHAFRAMGVDISQPAATSLVVKGVGLHGLKAPPHDLDMGNSGTAMRLMCGLLAGQAFPTRLVGDASLSRRPMKRVTGPLSAMGAQITGTEGRAPLAITPTPAGLTGQHYVSPVASAQVKSCLLLAGLYASGETRVTESHPSRDHTERMLRSFGVAVETDATGAAVRGGQMLTATDIQVPADISSAAFFMVASAIVPGAEVTLLNIGVNPTRTGILDILLAMGADIRRENERFFGAEPVADITVRGGNLRGIAIDPALVASAIDEFPVVFIAAACAEGVTLISGAEELRVKESDRILAMVDGLRALGVAIEDRADGARIEGLGRHGFLAGGTVDSLGDHRVAMSFAVAALRAAAPLTIRDCANVATSFPGFVELARAAGIGIAVHAEAPPETMA